MLGLAYWNPLIWLLGFVVLTGGVYIFRSRGQKKYKKGTAQTEIFLSGEQPPDVEQRHIKAHNIYWGFFETLAGYYDRNIRAHTGIVNDYVMWLVVVIAITAVILFVVGLL
jgi:multicomponent Na+:H+ antiporter subunit D